MRAKLFALLALAAALLSGCGYNEIQRLDETVTGSWSEVLNQYKRRADLIPNLVSVVQGYAAHEREVLTQVTNARANVAGIKATPELVNDPEAFAKFQRAQGELSGALSRLLVVAENYPNLKADANFRDLQAQVEGTENRIAVARNRYIKAVQDYNVTVRQFPVNLTAMMFGYRPKANFTVEDERAISTPPSIRFDGSGARPAPGATPQVPAQPAPPAQAAPPAPPASPPAPAAPAPRSEAAPQPAPGRSALSAGY